MGGAYSMRETLDKCIKQSSRKPKGKRLLLRARRKWEDIKRGSQRNRK
jgi:hypothetical protein